MCIKGHFQNILFFLKLLVKITFTLLSLSRLFSSKTIQYIGMYWTSEMLLPF